jgi:TonB family protein
MRFAIAFVLLAACVAGRPIPTASVAAGNFPVRRSVPDLPTVRSMSPRWVAMDALSARVAVCVTPVGDTVSVRLERSSGDGVFDAAIVEDVGRWHYEPFAASTMACERTTVTFVP